MSAWSEHGDQEFVGSCDRVDLDGSSGLARALRRCLFRGWFFVMAMLPTSVSSSFYFCGLPRVRSQHFSRL